VPQVPPAFIAAPVAPVGAPLVAPVAPVGAPPVAPVGAPPVPSLGAPPLVVAAPVAPVMSSLEFVKVL